MHINQISQYFKVYLPFNLIMITKSSTLFVLKAWILSITSLYSLADVRKYNHRHRKRDVLFDKSVRGFDWLQEHLTSKIRVRNKGENSKLTKLI